jgi:hypothetical protein
MNLLGGVLTVADLRAWAEAHPNMTQAIAVLDLLDRLTELDRLNRALSDRGMRRRNQH